MYPPAPSCITHTHTHTHTHTLRDRFIPHIIVSKVWQKPRVQYITFAKQLSSIPLLQQISHRNITVFTTIKGENFSLIHHLKTEYCVKSHLIFKQTWYAIYTIALLYLVCPDVLCTVGETSYGIQVGSIESHTVFTVLLNIYLLIGINILVSLTTFYTTSLTLLSYWTASVSQFLCLLPTGFPTQRSVSNPYYLSTMVPRNEVDNEIYDAHNWGQ